MDNRRTMSNRSSPPRLFRFNRYVSATSGRRPRRQTPGSAIEAMDRMPARCSMIVVRRVCRGPRRIHESSNTLVFAFLLALMLVYLILSRAVREFPHPLIIMFTGAFGVWRGHSSRLWIFRADLEHFQPDWRHRAGRDCDQERNSHRRVCQQRRAQG